MNSPVAAKDIIEQLDGEFPVDEAMIEGTICPRIVRSLFLTLTIALPAGINFVSAEPYGNSAWTITGKVFTTLPDGSEKLFFLKVRPITRLIL